MKDEGPALGRPDPLVHVADVDDAESMTRAFVVNGRQMAKAKEHFREVIHTTEQTQIGVMVVPPTEEFAEEPCACDVTLLVVSGDGVLTLEDDEFELARDVVALIPAGLGYAVHNRSSKPLRMIALSSPPMLERRSAMRPRARVRL
jgi:mannose-6-phosphate isomerase-like protein (cupin superfamily)